MKVCECICPLCDSHCLVSVCMCEGACACVHEGVRMHLSTGREPLLSWCVCLGVCVRESVQMQLSTG